jgi:site-specific DNA recombinase
LTRGPLAVLLRNRFYIGEVRYRGEVFPGEQTAILDRSLFDAVQTKLDQQRTNYAKTRQQSDSLLMGRIFDNFGNRMTPSYAVKKGVRYRYYISAALIQGQLEKAAKLSRVPAAEIETLIINAVRKHLGANTHNGAKATSPSSLSDKELISTHIARVDVKPDHLAIQLAAMPGQNGVQNRRRPLDYSNDQGQSGDHSGHSHPNADILVVPWKKTPSKRPRGIIPPAPTSPRQDPRPIRAETRAKLVTAIARGRLWLDELTAGTCTNEQIAAKENCTVRQVNMTISLAFLAPALVQAAVDGRLPRGIGIASLRDAPAEWSRQHAMLGLAS